MNINNNRAAVSVRLCSQKKLKIKRKIQKWHLWQRRRLFRRRSFAICTASARNMYVMCVATRRMSGARQSVELWAKSKYEICMNWEWYVNDGRDRKKTTYEKLKEPIRGPRSHSQTHSKQLSYYYFFASFFSEMEFSSCERADDSSRVAVLGRLSLPLHGMWGALGTTSLSTPKQQRYLGSRINEWIYEVPKNSRLARIARVRIFPFHRTAFAGIARFHSVAEEIICLANFQCSSCTGSSEASRRRWEK